MKEWGGLAIAGERIEEISGSLQKLSNCFLRDFQIQKKLSEKQKEQIFDNICATLCYGCEQEKRCHTYYSYDNFSAIMKLLKDSEQYPQEQTTMECELADINSSTDKNMTITEESLEENKEQLEVDKAQEFLKRCIHLEDFMYTATEEFIAAEQQLQMRNRMAEVRMLAGGQLKELSSVLKNFSQAIYRGKNIEYEYYGKLAAELRRHHMEMEDAVFLEDQNGMLQILVTVRSKWNGCVAAKEVAELAGRAIGKKMRLEGNGTKLLTDHYEVIRLSQDAQFKIFTGIARTVKAGNTISGDTFSIKELPDAKTACMLSDGMGSGVMAQQESCMVIELLEEFLEAGFSVQAAMRMVNTLFLTDMQNPSAVTADISLLNLYNGIVTFYKAGAAPSYLKRGSTIITIEESMLPAGMFAIEELEPKVHKLYQGDFLIMMTDGVLEALHAENKDQMMKGYLSMLSVRSPQEMADRILNFAIDHEEDGLHDDMTVLVIAVYENQRKRHFRLKR